MEKKAAAATLPAIVSVPVFAAGTEGGFNGPVSTSPVSQVQRKAGDSMMLMPAVRLMLKSTVSTGTG